MKKLFLIRHAKSSWDEQGVTDLKRPLNKRGKRDAPFMGKLLHKGMIIPEQIYSSPAVRAITTANIFANELKFEKKNIHVFESIYSGGIRELEDLIQNFDDDYNSVFIFGHNPTFTVYANHLGDKYIANMPTCSIVGFELNVKRWAEVERGKGKTFLFEYPKKYFK
ncbi:MAG: histidine phosphatase family protein [Ignavibacteria bacterium]|nr:histidine phosphatase family protein [Ignavibacteria bacterium]